ncbi:MAG: DUF4179 domain-containing protein [Eubacteriales bacterium]|nr:DUF4179 domain-containing protein [Eubacteriales bacterium]
MNIKLNDKEKQLQNQLRKDVEIPPLVRDKVNEAYRKIENKEVSQQNPPRNTYRWIKTTAKVLEGTAAALAIGFLVCVTNPVMAKELPLVGGLFEQLQDNVSFFGNFADRATKLEEPEKADTADMQGSDSAVDTADTQNTDSAADAADTQNTDNAVNTADTQNTNSTADAAESSDGLYTKTQDGLTVTFSEVYANDQAIYLTMQLKSEEPFPDTMMDQTDTGTEKPVINMLLNSYYDFLENQDESSGFNDLNLEGMYQDEHTYSCIVRLDLASAAKDTSEYDERYNAMVQSVYNEMGITEDDLNDETEEGYALLTEFNDKVSAQGGALKSYIKDIPVPDTFSLHLDIQQIVGNLAEPEYWDSGYTKEELSAMSEEEWRAVMDQQPAEYRQYPNKYENFWYDGPWSFDIPITVDRSQTEVLELNDTNEAGIGLESVIKTPYELTVNELYEEGSDSDTFMVALDANGNKLPYNDSNGDCSNFAIQDRDISTVDIYILDYVQYMDELKGEERYNNNENKPEEEKWSTLLDANAKYHKTIHFDS